MVKERKRMKRLYDLLGLGGVIESHREEIKYGVGDRPSKEVLYELIEEKANDRDINFFINVSKKSDDGKIEYYEVLFYREK